MEQRFSPILRTNLLVRLKQFIPQETELCATGKKARETEVLQMAEKWDMSRGSYSMLLKRKKTKAGLIRR